MGRKRVVTDDTANGDVGVPNKKSKVSPKTGNAEETFSATWVHGDDRCWAKYTDDEVVVINDAAFKKKRKKFTIPKRPIELEFTMMVHKNKDDGNLERLRYCVKTAAVDSWHTWTYENNRGQKVGFPPDAVLILETAHNNGTVPGLVTVGKKQFKMNLATMMQTDTDTDAQSKILREQVSVNNDKKDDEDKEEDVDVDADTTDAKKGKKNVRSASKGKNSKKAATDEEKDEAQVKTVIIKGKAPVDSFCPLAGSVHVYTEGNTVYDAMLNQTNVQNNNNKFYIVQVLEDDCQKAYHFWARWGRVGKVGQNSLTSCGPNASSAIAAFKKKFQEKTKNSWDSRHNFVKKPGLYDLLEMDYSTDKIEEMEEAKQKDEKPKKDLMSTLEGRVKALIELISDKSAMEQVVAEMKYDSKKAPLGKLTKEQVKNGYMALKKIEKCIVANETGQKLIDACNEYYTRIPHDFGMKRPPLISTKEEVLREASLLEALGDIQIALTIIKEQDESVHPCDSFYNSLQCKLEPLDSSDEEYKMINSYLLNTHAKTHSQYNLKLVNAFKCTREEEVQRFVDYGNRKLLWHGSRLTNWASILKQGLRIAPPEAPVTGYMFGKGVYFADMSSKSANYCYATRSNNEGLLVLCEVSLGNCNELLDSDCNANELPKGKHSVHALGSTAPDPKSEKMLPDGVVVPMGKGIETGVKNPNGYTLLYNEYIVYDVCQVKIRYLLRVKFNYK